MTAQRANVCFYKIGRKTGYLPVLKSCSRKTPLHSHCSAFITSEEEPDGVNKAKHDWYVAVVIPREGVASDPVPPPGPFTAATKYTWFNEFWR